MAASLLITATRVDTITMAVLLPIWTGKAETTRRVRQRMGTVKKWAVAQGYRTDNPAGQGITSLAGELLDDLALRHRRPTAVAR